MRWPISTLARSTSTLSAIGARQWQEKAPNQNRAMTSALGSRSRWASSTPSLPNV